MSTPDVITKGHFHNIATKFDDLYESESRGGLQRKLDDWLRASVYRRFELTICPLYFYSQRKVEDVCRAAGASSFKILDAARDYVVVIEK